MARKTTRAVPKATPGATLSWFEVENFNSPTLIDAVEDPVSLFIVENDDKKGTVVTPALTREKALRAILAESGQKLGEVWLDGLLGGVPEGDA